MSEYIGCGVGDESVDELKQYEKEMGDEDAAAADSPPVWTVPVCISEARDGACTHLTLFQPRFCPSSSSSFCVIISYLRVGENIPFAHGQDAPVPLREANGPHTLIVTRPWPV